MVEALRVDWESKRPTSWVAFNVENYDGEIGSSAWTELSGRFERGELSDQQINNLIEMCLAEQARDELRPMQSVEMVRLLATPAIYSAMSEAQVQRMFEQMTYRVALEVRPQIGPEIERPLRFTQEQRSPGWWVRLWLASLRCNGEEIAKDEPLGGGVGIGGWNQSSIAASLLAGRCELEAVVVTQVFVGYAAMIEGQEPVWVSAQRTLTASTEVVEATPPPKFVRSPELDAEILASVKLTQCRGGPATWLGSGSYLNATVRCQPPPPCDLAFELIARFDGFNVPLRTLAMRPSDTSEVQSLGFDKPIRQDVPKTVDFVLIPSRDAAWSEHDMFEVWGGALLFENVPVNPTVQVDFMPAVYSGRLVDPADYGFHPE